MIGSSTRGLRGQGNKPLARLSHEFLTLDLSNVFKRWTVHQSLYIFLRVERVLPDSLGHDISYPTAISFSASVWHHVQRSTGRPSHISNASINALGTINTPCFEDECASLWDLSTVNVTWLQGIELWSAGKYYKSCIHQHGLLPGERGIASSKCLLIPSSLSLLLVVHSQTSFHETQNFRSHYASPTMDHSRSVFLRICIPARVSAVLRMFERLALTSSSCLARLGPNPG